MITHRHTHSDTLITILRFPIGGRRSNILRQVVHTHVLLSPSSRNWYRPRGGDDLWLGR